MKKDSLDRILRKSAIITSLIGLADSIYLIVLKYSHSESMCLGNGGCATVNASSYSQIYGIPISALGAVGYFAILLVLVYEKKIRLPFLTPGIILFGMSLVGVLFSAYLTYLEFYIIHAVCPFCVLSAITITIIFVIAIIRLIRNQPEY